VTISADFPADLTVAVMTHNNSATLDSVLETVAACGCPLSRTMVVDSASTDRSPDIAAARLGAAQVIKLAANEGPNPARNRALRQATTPYMLVLDADVLLTHEAPAALRRAMDEDRVAVGAPLVMHISRPDVIQYGGGGVHFICEAVNPWMDRPLSERGLDDRDIGAAPGAALLIDVAKAQAVGGFDDRYFMGKEDGDFLHRLRIAGYRLRETPAARVMHHSRQRSSWLFEYQVRNRWHFLLRNYQLRTLIILAPALAVHEVLQLTVLALKGHLGAWFRGCVGLARLLPALPRDRAIVRRFRRVGDRHLLRDDPLVVRTDVGGGLLKSAYDVWLRAYWRAVRPLIDGREFAGN
jgi:GT2 family glycosyltransferase